MGLRVRHAPIALRISAYGGDAGGLAGPSEPALTRLVSVRGNKGIEFCQGEGRRVLLTGPLTE
jgi:hypothetical protein